jgi:predicted Zn-dependent protease
MVPRVAVVTTVRALSRDRRSSKKRKVTSGGTFLAERRDKPSGSFAHGDDCMPAKTRKEQIEEMLREEPNDPELLYMLAMEHVSSGQDEEAMRWFRELMTRRPDYAPGFHQAARSLARLNKMDDARRVLEQGIPLALKQGNQHAADEMQELLASLA